MMKRNKKPHRWTSDELDHLAQVVEDSERDSETIILDRVVLCHRFGMQLQR